METLSEEAVRVCSEYIHDIKLIKDPERLREEAIYWRRCAADWHVYAIKRDRVLRKFRELPLHARIWIAISNSLVWD